MNRKPNPELVDDENPEWTEATFNRAVTYVQLPETLQEKLGGQRHSISVEQGDMVAVPISADVVNGFRAAGAGWEQQINAVLAEWLLAHQPTKPRP
jgi:uncharacterized protein (DUF4415 family)